MKKALVVVLALLILTALGSVNRIAVVPYIVIITVVVVSVLIALDKISKRYYPVYIYGLMLALLWQTSMLGSHIVGADIHGEFYMTKVAITEGWDMSFTYVNNTSLVLSVVAPLLAKLGFDPVWQFKALYPAVFACVPVILYYAYRKMLGEKRAYFAVLFFVITPISLVEIVGIVKSMVAEVFLASIVLFTVIDIKSWQRMLGLGVSVSLAAMCHYTIGVLAIAYLVGIFGVMTAGSTITFFLRKLRLSTLHIRWKMSALYFILIIAIFAAPCYFWYSSIGDGFMIKVLGVIANYTAFGSQVIHSPELLNGHEPLLRTALGLDFGNVPLEGKAFRVLQFLVQFLVAIGFVYLLFRRGKYAFTAEFIAGVIVSFCLLGMCLLLVGFSTNINASRFYQVSLFFLAPMLVVGAEQIINDLGRLKCLRKYQ